MPVRQWNRNNEEKARPVLLLERIPGSPHGRAWCPWCRIHHHHGYVEGHAVAHCDDQNSPFDRSGYYLVLPGSPITPRHFSLKT